MSFLLSRNELLYRKMTLHVQKNYTACIMHAVLISKFVSFCVFAKFLVFEKSHENFRENGKSGTFLIIFGAGVSLK
jgi:hypothetical protein